MARKKRAKARPLCASARCLRVLQRESDTFCADCRGVTRKRAPVGPTYFRERDREAERVEAERVAAAERARLIEEREASWATYQEGEAKFGDRLTAAARRAKTLFHKPPNEETAKRWVLVELFGRPRAARMLDVSETAVRKAHDRVENLIRQTPGLRDEVDDILAEADQWREAHGAPGDVSQFTRMGVNPAALVQTYRRDGREVRTAQRSVDADPGTEVDVREGARA